MQFYGQSASPHIPLEEAARILRVSKWTLYRNLESIPHIRLGPYIHIACEFMYLMPPVIKVGSRSYQEFHWWQPPLPFDLPPQGVRWRNTGRLVVPKRNP